MNNELASEGFFYEELDKVTQVLRLLLNGLLNDKVRNRLRYKLAKHAPISLAESCVHAPLT